MNIQRGTFLALTAAIAQAACTVVQNTGTGGTGGTTGGTGGSAGVAQGGQSIGGSAGTAGSTASEGGAAGTAGSTASGGGGAGGATGGSGGATGGSGGATGGSGGATSCDDSVGTPGNCANLNSVPNCAGQWQELQCQAAVTNFKPKVAAAATACILQITDCATTTIDAYTCQKTALAAACADATADSACAQAATACSDAVTSAACHAMVDGLNATGLAAVTTCIESGCTYGLWSCIESL